MKIKTLMMPKQKGARKVTKLKVTKEFLLAFLRRWKDASHADCDGNPSFWNTKDQQAYLIIIRVIKGA